MEASVVMLPLTSVDLRVEFVGADIRQNTCSYKRRLTATARTTDEQERAAPASLFSELGANRHDFIFASKEDRRVLEFKNIQASERGAFF